MKRSELPRAGLLQDVRVLSTGVIVAGPLAAALMAEFGAEVVHVESAKGPDLLHDQRSTWGLQHRNQRLITLDIPAPEGREVFLKLIAESDIWIESSKGGTFDRWGLGDDELWKVNPRLVIVHVSGFGQRGVPDRVRRPAYDVIAQAYSGLMTWNGTPDSGPLQAKPTMGDHIPPLFAAFAAVAALHRARRSGVGESIDVAQYEALVRVQGSMIMHYLNDGTLYPRVGNENPQWAVSDTFRCADGKWVLVQLMGRTAWRNAVSFFGLAGHPDFPATLDMVPRQTPAGDGMEQRIREFCDGQPAAEVEKAFADAGLACSRVMEPEDMLTDEHYLARGTFTEWFDESLGATVRGPAIIPRVRNHPTTVWRAGPPYSADTDDVLAELGYDPAQREALYDKRVAIRYEAP